MKKILILQNKGKQVGGVWFVNKTIGEYFISLGYSVSIVSIRNNQVDITQEYDKRMCVFTINEIDKWEITRKNEIFKCIKEGKIISALKKYRLRKEELKKLNNDYDKLKKYIREYNPDYIINSHYQLLDAIPTEYLPRTLNEQHLAYETTKSENPQAIKYFNYYKNKIHKFIWLSMATSEFAKKDGLENSTCIYNPIRFKSAKSANVTKNKKLITISRIDSYQKRIDLMVEIVNEVFKEKEFKDWEFDIYGTGNLPNECIDIVNKSKQINFYGKTDNPSKELLNASIYLSTSYTEGFPLSILEANECGLPAITYYFGESTYEVVLDNKTGYIIPFNDKKKYIEKLKDMMRNLENLKELSKQSKEYATKFSTEEVCQQWIKAFDEIDKKNQKEKN